MTSETRTEGREGPRGIPGFCFDIDGQWWNGHGPGSGCGHCDSLAATPNQPAATPTERRWTIDCPKPGCDGPDGHDGGHVVNGTPRRGTALLLSDFERLEEWCRLVRVVFDGEVPYLVGSAARTTQYRDIDLRLILRDAVYDRWWSNPVKVRLANRAVSIWGQKETGLPIDFQIQRMTEANDAFGGEYRNPMGLRDWTTQVPSGHPGGKRHD
jgi:hypothetical protein